MWQKNCPTFALKHTKYHLKIFKNACINWKPFQGYELDDGMFEWQCSPNQSIVTTSSEIKILVYSTILNLLLKIFSKHLQEVSTVQFVWLIWRNSINFINQTFKSESCWRGDKFLLYRITERVDEKLNNVVATSSAAVMHTCWSSQKVSFSSKNFSWK